MSRSKFYNRASVSVTIDGDTVEGFSDGDSAIRIIPAENIASKQVGLDGTMISFSNDMSGMCELDLKPTSSTLKQIYGLYNSQMTENARLFDITIATGVGEFHSLSGCAIDNVGEIESGGPEGQKRTISFVVSTVSLDQAS